MSAYISTRPCPAGSLSFYSSLYLRFKYRGFTSVLSASIFYAQNYFSVMLLLKLMHYVHSFFFQFVLLAV